MADLKGAVIGCGFFARNHLHAWREVEGATIAAVCDLDLERAEAFAQEFDVPEVFADPETLLRSCQWDFVDIVTQPAMHRSLVELAAQERVPAICQKPLAPNLEDARAMVTACEVAGIPLMVHENFRWQKPMRAVKKASEAIGAPFFGRITWRSGYDVYANQPYLAEDPRFILTDLGVHLLDLARFFLGEVEQLYCQTRRVNPQIQGEDSATVMLRMRSGATCVVELSFASHPAQEPFPEASVLLEGNEGSVALEPGFRLTVNRQGYVHHPDAQPHLYPWSTRPFQAIQESVVAIQQHWVDCLRTGKEPETSGHDNLRTLELVFGAYDSAASSGVVAF